MSQSVDRCTSKLTSGRARRAVFAHTMRRDPAKIALHSSAIVEPADIGSIQRENRRTCTCCLLPILRDASAATSNRASGASVCSRGRLLHSPVGDRPRYSPSCARIRPYARGGGPSCTPCQPRNGTEYCQKHSTAVESTSAPVTGRSPAGTHPLCP